MFSDLPTLALIVLWLVPSTITAQLRLGHEQALRLTAEAPAPAYSGLAMQAKLQGLVRIDVLVSESGGVVSATFLSGHPLLAKAALEAAKRRSYRPLLVNGKPTPFITTVEYGGPAGLPYPSRDGEDIVTRFESNVQPVVHEICGGDRASFPAKSGQIDVPMERRQRFEIRSCGAGGATQVQLYESNMPRPTLVYTTSDSWPSQVHHISNVLVFPLSGSAGGVLIFHFRNGQVQPVSGGHTQYGVGVQVNEDGTEVAVRFPHANRGPKTEVLRFPLEY